MALGPDAIGDADESERVPQLEGAPLPTEAPAHRAVDRGDVVGDLGRDLGRVEEAVARDRPGEGRATPLGRGERTQAVVQVFDRPHRVDLGEARAGLGSVLEAGQVERLDHALAVGVAALAVEAGTGLLADELLLDHAREHLERAEGVEARIVGRALDHVLGHVQERVESDQIDGAEHRALRPAHQRSGEEVDLGRGQFLLEHQLHAAQHGVGADAVGHEVGAVLGHDHALAEHVLAEAREVGDDVRIRVGTGDQLQQVHVTRRVEEVRAQQARTYGLRDEAGQRGDRDAARVAGQQRVRTDRRGDAPEQRFLHVGALDDGLDHPVDVGQAPEVVVEVARADPRENGAVDQGRGLVLGQGLQRRVHRRAADGRRVAGGRVGGGQIEQVDLESTVGQVAGDGAAHDPGAEDGRPPEDPRDGVGPVR